MELTPTGDSTVPSCTGNEVLRRVPRNANRCNDSVHPLAIQAILLAKYDADQSENTWHKLLLPPTACQYHVWKQQKSWIKAWISIISNVIQKGPLILHFFHWIHRKCIQLWALTKLFFTLRGPGPKPQWLWCSEITVPTKWLSSVWTEWCNWSPSIFLPMKMYFYVFPLILINHHKTINKANVATTWLTLTKQTFNSVASVSSDEVSVSCKLLQ